MPGQSLIVVAVVAAVIVLLWIFGPRLLARVFTALPLLALALFCFTFGYDGSNEVADRSLQLAWKAGYVTVGIACLTGVTWLLWPRRSKPK